MSHFPRIRVALLLLLGLAFFQSLFAAHFMAAFGMVFLAGFILPSKKERDRARADSTRA